MMFMQFSCIPAESSAATDAFAEAIINCWINREDRAEAESLARSVIADQGWCVENLEDHYTITREDYADGHSREGLEAYDNAERDGHSFICHTYFAGPKLN